MDKQEQKKYAELTISMATDFLMKGITFETFISNLKIMVNKIEILADFHKEG